MAATTVRLQGYEDTGTGRQAPVEVEVSVADGVIVADATTGGSAMLVRNENAAMVANELVYISGWSETYSLPLVTKADANAAGKQAQFVCRAAIAQYGTGVVTTAFRTAANVNTNAVTTAGDPVYLSETAGGWTETAPTAAGSSVQIVGRCAIKSATVGVIEFDLRDFPTITENDIQPLAITNASIATAAAIAYSKLATLASARLVVGSAGNVATAVDVTGDVTISNAGVTAIGSAKVTNAMLANGAGVGALLTAGLGGSASVLKTDTATHTIAAAHGTKDRACIVMVVVDETYAVGTGTLPALVIGEADTTNKFMAAGTLDTEAAGTVLFFAGTNTATKAITATSTAAVGNATGGCSITVLAIPTT